MLDKVRYCNGQFGLATSGGLVLVHGGAGSQDPRGSALATASAVIEAIAKRGAEQLAAGTAGMAVVAQCLRELELAPEFNAGLGAALQADGEARLTAAVMNGPEQMLSGVMGLEGAIHPSVLAMALQHQKTRVMGPPGTAALAMEAGLERCSPVTPERRARWEAARLANETHDQDTVGCVVVTAAGDLFCGTSTGGRGFERPGRVSDAATAAGTYASKFAAVSATGVGEEIVDDGLAVRLETRVRDGMDLPTASELCLQEAHSRGRSYGWIALSHTGAWNIAWTTDAMTYAGAAANHGVFVSSRELL